MLSFTFLVFKFPLITKSLKVWWGVSKEECWCWVCCACRWLWGYWNHCCLPRKMYHYLNESTAVACSILLIALLIFRVCLSAVDTLLRPFKSVVSWSAARVSHKCHAFLLKVCGVPTFLTGTFSSEFSIHSSSAACADFFIAVPAEIHLCQCICTGRRGSQCVAWRCRCRYQCWLLPRLHGSMGSAAWRQWDLLRFDLKLLSSTIYLLFFGIDCEPILFCHTMQFWNEWK